MRKEWVRLEFDRRKVAKGERNRDRKRVRVSER